jgi:hypothetical protein
VRSQIGDCSPKLSGFPRDKNGNGTMDKSKRIKKHRDVIERAEQQIDGGGSSGSSDDEPIPYKDLEAADKADRIRSIVDQWDQETGRTDAAWLDQELLVEVLESMTLPRLAD